MFHPTLKLIARVTTELFTLDKISGNSGWHDAATLKLRDPGRGSVSTLKLPCIGLSSSPRYSSPFFCSQSMMEAFRHVTIANSLRTRSL